MSAPPHPVVGKFDEDTRVFVDQQSGKHHYEDDDGVEWEYTGVGWIQIVDDDLLKAQQSAYSIQGVDENAPANAVLAREEKREAQKRKKEAKKNNQPIPSSSRNATNGASSSSSTSNPAPTAPKKTAVFVTNLPPTTTAAQLASTFSKAGVLLIDDEGEPRIKLYHDDDGKFKGEALVMYFKEGSVDLAITLLDDTELELGAGMGNMRVKVADYGDTKGVTGKQGLDKDKESANGNANGNGETKGDEKGDSKAVKRKEYSAEEKQKMTKRIRMMQNKITWTSDDEDEDPLAPIGGAPRPGENRMNRVVVLKGMFKLEDLEKDPALLLELKDEVREEAETLGMVTSVVLYDKEADGVMTVKFKDPLSAQACVLRMNNRYFDGRRIFAGIYTGKERFKKSGNRSLADEDEDEGKRLDGFAAWLVDGSDEES